MLSSTIFNPKGGLEGPLVILHLFSGVAHYSPLIVISTSVTVIIIITPIAHFTFMCTPVLQSFFG